MLLEYRPRAMRRRRFVRAVMAVGLTLCTSSRAFAQDPAQTPPPPQEPKGPQPVTEPAPPIAPFRDEGKTDKTDKTMVIELTSLRILHEKGIINDAEYESAIKDIAETSGGHAPDANTILVGKFATTLYGFIEADGVYDSTQSLNEAPKDTQIQKGGTFAGDHDRLQFSVRNTRFGFRSKAPEYHGIRASAQLEMDFLGATLPIGQSSSTTPYFGTEANQYTAPTMRARHLNLKMETPYVDLLFGQYWSLFGWQSVFHPNTVEIQGVPGELYQRNVQLRLSKSVKTEAITFEAAIAGVRPPQRDSALPEGQAGIFLGYNKWTGVNTNGATATRIAPLSVAITGDMKAVRMPELSATPKDTKNKVGTGFAVDGFIPIIPGDKGHMANSLALNGEFAYGYGTADQYDGVGGAGTAYPTLPNPTNANPAPVYAPNIDPGIVQFDNGGELHFIQWSSWLVGAQYYLPGLNGKVWVSGNYSHMTSSNIQEFGPAAKVRSDLDWFDVNLFTDVTPALRFAAEFAWTQDKYADGTHATNDRAQISGFYLF
jgi:hypothetical protein